MVPGGSRGCERQGILHPQPVNCCVGRKTTILPLFLDWWKLVEKSQDLGTTCGTAYVLAFESLASAVVPSWTLMSA